MISREHPLKGAPLVGAQLRYLIMAGENDILGRYRFWSPFFLSIVSRLLDWVGCPSDRPRTELLVHRFVAFSDSARRALSQPDHGQLQVDLATGARGLVRALRSQARCWSKPMWDRSTYTGKSLVAANWLRLGQSLGRGRTTASTAARPQSVKDVWVWQWDPKLARGCKSGVCPGWCLNRSLATARETIGLRKN